jgi:tetratricopeptide (TPR) repeat protein
VKRRAAVVLAISLPLACGASDSQWTAVRSSHFEIYSQAGERDGRSAALWFEQLRAFFALTAHVQAGGDVESHGPVRVIGFESAKEYAQFQLRPAADAYFVGGEAADYIVMPTLGSEEFRVAAHEYAHLVLHSMRVRLPPWLEEGIAEFFSTVRLSEKGCVIGGDLPMRTPALRQMRWIPLAELLIQPASTPKRADRNEAGIFYAESWALTSMLILSPAYAPRLSELLDAASSGTLEAGTITRIYNKPLDSIMADLRAWVQRPRTGVPLPGIPSVNLHVEVSELTSFEAGRLMADLLLASNELKRAEAAYQMLANERPDDPLIAAALGNIALRQGDRDKAREQWKRAIHFGIRDATVCYRYAILAEDAGVAPDEIGAALRRAIELKPDFDDARYKLGLLESNRGHYEAALEQFRAMRPVAAGRAYGYWMAVASALTETDQREEAKKAAAKAMSYATSAEERAATAQLAYVADTDLTVQLSQDGNGKLQMITTRKPHGSNDWNPFIEPGDEIRYLEGQIRKVECVAGKITGFRVESAVTAVEVALPDPARVLIRGGTPEFTCGAEDGREVAIQYAVSENHGAADGVLRGMQFK